MNSVLIQNNWLHLKKWERKNVHKLIPCEWEAAAHIGICKSGETASVKPGSQNLTNPIFKISEGHDSGKFKRVT